MLRTWSVRLPHIALTVSVRSFQVPATPGTSAWPPSLPSVPTSRATRVTSEANERSWSTIVLMASFSCRISPRTSTVIFFDRSPLATAIVTSAMLRTCAVRLRRHRVDALGQVLPHAGDLAHLRLAAELAVGADLARDARHLGGEDAELLDHRVDDGGRAQELALAAAGRRRRAARSAADRPCATAAIARVTSVVGHSRSSISVLTEVSISPQAPLGQAEIARAGGSCPRGRRPGRPARAARPCAGWRRRCR